MPRRATGQPFRTADGWGIRWTEDGKRPRRTGFRTKTEATAWFRDNVAGRLDRGAPSAEITYERFCELYLARHAGEASTVRTLREWLAPSREAFGDWTLRELEGAADDVAAWRAGFTGHKRYRVTRGMREALGAAVRWRYLRTNPAAEAGPNPQPRAQEIDPFTPAEVDAIAVEIGPAFGPLVVVAAETGLRTNEWAAAERRDVDRADPALVVARRFANGVATPYPKTERRRVPLSSRGEAALELVVPRVDTPLLFPAEEGGPIELHNWRRRHWYPALEAAGLTKRGPYQLRHTFATEALAAGVTLFQLSRLMGASVETIDAHYGHLARDAGAEIRGLLNARAERKGREKDETSRR